MLQSKHSGSIGEFPPDMTGVYRVLSSRADAAPTLKAPREKRQRGMMLNDGCIHPNKQRNVAVVTEMSRVRILFL